MGEGPAEVARPVTLREHWLALAVPALLIVAVSVVSGQFLCALMESPIVAPQRENPALYVVVVTILWAAPTAVAWGIAAVGGRLAGLTGAVRRRWRLLAVGLVGATWAVAVLRYVADPLTARRWALYWPMFYG